MRTPLWLLLALMVLAVTVAACGSTEEASKSYRPPTTTVEVDNRNVLDVTVYVERNGFRVRLGQVSGHSSDVFTIPPEVVQGGPLRFVADPIGQIRSLIDEIPVFPGDQVLFIVPPR